MRPEYTHELAEGGRIIKVVDLDRGGTITNWAERIVGELRLLYGDLQHRIIVYRDTAGVWDEIRLNDGKYAGFAPIRTTTFEEAVQKLRAAGRLLND